MSDVALVTGASGGIGAAVAREIHARAGDALILALHYHGSRAAAEALAREIPGAFAVRADLTSPADRQALLAAVLERGTPAVLVNAAGDDRPHEPALAVEEASVEHLLALNLAAPLVLMKLFGREMARAGGGVIVNVSSVLAHRALTGSAVYRATKAALEELTRQFAAELGPRGIRVNAVAPGFIETAMTARLPEEAKERVRGEIATGGLGKPEHVARAVWELIDNEYLNGAVLPVDGGMRL